MSNEEGIFESSGAIWVWRGPAPYYFVTVPEPQASGLKEWVRAVSYGWGMIPVSARIGRSEWRTALWPKDGGYIMPIKVSVRRAEGIDEDDVVTLTLTVGGSEG